MEATTTNINTTTTHSAITINSNNNQHEHESKDEVDFVAVAINNNNNNIIKPSINNNYEMNIKKINDSHSNSDKLRTATENIQININNSSNNSNSNNINNINNNNNNNNHRSNNNSSEIVPKSLILKEATQNQVPKNNKDSSSTSTSPTPAPNIQNNNNNSKMKMTVAVQQQHTEQQHREQPQQPPTKRHSAKDRLSLFSFSKKISQKSTAATAAVTTNNICSSNSSSNTNIGSYKDNTTETTTPATPNTTSYECENQSRSAALEKYKPLSMSCDTPVTSVGSPPPPPPRHHHKFVKSTSISRLFGNTYNAKKFEKQEQKRLANDSKFNTYGGRRRASGPYLERFKRYAKEEGDELDTSAEVAAEARERNATIGGAVGGNCKELQHSTLTTVERHEDLGAKAMRTISRGLGKLWWKRTHSVEISTPDPEFKVSYLGNVLTGWAKGEGCVEKQLNTLWRNYTQNSKPDVIMRIKVCASGLKATTRQHGLTEYWANRITHCCAPKNYPRVFCWIYRHEGRKLKHELRCHAVLCSKEKIVQDICNTLKENLERALREFKREKILKQNARLSLANAAYDNPSLPRRKILLSVGGNNYRPPLERSKSAPKLMAIEEAIGEEDGDDIEETNEPEMKSCCQKDSLYPAMTLGRRRCRRGHSIRRTGGKTRASVSFDKSAHMHAAGECCKEHHHDTKDKVIVEKLKTKTANADEKNDEQRNSYGSDESDDFEKLLKYNNYDTNASLEHELLPYFDMQLHKTALHSSLGDLTELKDEIEQPLSLMPTINSAPNADPEAEYIPTDIVDDHDDDDVEVMVGLRRSGVCSDGEEDYLDADDMYFRQASILNMLHRNSMRKMANLSLSSGDESSSIETNASSVASLQYRHQLQSSISSNASSTGTAASSSALDGGDTVAKAAAQRKQQQLNADSDEGSISSGCETASTVTANQDDISLKYCQQSMQRTAAEVDATMDAAQLMMSEHDMLEEEPITADEIYQRLESRLQRRQNSDATTFSSSSSITLKMGGSSPTTSMGGGGGGANEVAGTGTGGCVVNVRTRRQRRQSASTQRSSVADGDSDDSECSDESGYVEFQERDKQTLTRERDFTLNGEQTVDTKATTVIKQQQQQLPSKPQPPPKPMPRRLLLSTGSGSTSTAV